MLFFIQSVSVLFTASSSDSAGSIPVDGDIAVFCPASGDPSGGISVYGFVSHICCRALKASGSIPVGGPVSVDCCRAPKASGSIPVGGSVSIDCCRALKASGSIPVRGSASGRKDHSKKHKKKKEYTFKAETLFCHVELLIVVVTKKGAVRKGTTPEFFIKRMNGYFSVSSSG